MLKRKRQRKYLIKRCLKIRHLLRTFASSGEESELHKLRVELKKLKAFITLVKQYRGKEKVAVPQRCIRQLFHHAGNIREADLNLQIMKQFHINQPAVEARSGRILREESAKFRSHIARYDELIKDIVKSLLKLLHPLPDRKLKHWVNRQLKKIAIIVTATPTDQLHAARRRIKVLGYIYELCPKSLKTTLGLNTDYLDQLQNVIGEWHDEDAVVRLLDTYGSENKAGLDKLKKKRGQAVDVILSIGHHFWDKVSKHPSSHN